MLETLTANLAGKLRRERIADRSYLVAPMVMLTHGVHSGSNGPLYYPVEELSASPQSWDHKPVTINHPQVNGRPVSACTPNILAKFWVGLILNTSWDSKAERLKAEAWLDEKRLRTVDARAYTVVLAGRVTEVSTGLFTENVEVAGEWRGKRYLAVARNFVPDHLAILLDGVGACSVRNGNCGLLVNQQKGKHVCDCNNNDQLVDNLAGEDGFLLPPTSKFPNRSFNPFLHRRTQEDIEVEAQADEDHEADFSGQGGFAANEDDESEPLVAPSFATWNASRKK